MLLMNEYIIAFGIDCWGVLSGNELQRTHVHTSASVFKAKARAEKLAVKHGGVVEPFYGFNVRSTKQTVTAKQSQINRKTPYRSV